MARSIFLSFIFLVYFPTHSQPVTLSRSSDSSITLPNAAVTDTPNADWNALYLTTLSHSPSRSLTMLQTRYISTNSYGKKLYLLGLLYQYMSEREQPFYGIASNDSEYQAIEQAFVAALVEDR